MAKFKSAVPALAVIFASLTQIATVQSQQYYPPPPPDSAMSQPAYPQQQLDQLLAPIALYPDSLLSQILMAATYPLEVVEAARWSSAHPGLQGDAAVRAAEQQDWDPSVISLTAFPQILAMMNERLDWTESLGEAFLAQEPQMMDAIQQLRQQAYSAGTLRSNDQFRIVGYGQQIEIVPVNSQYFYLPYYDASTAYGVWRYPAYPPVYWRPWPGYHPRPGYAAAFAWGNGIRISANFFFGGVDWRQRQVRVVNVNNYYYRPTLNRPTAMENRGPGIWQHNEAHRRGEPYRAPALQQRFGNAGRPQQPGQFHPAQETRPPANMQQRPGNNNFARPEVNVPSTAARPNNEGAAVPERERERQQQFENRPGNRRFEATPQSAARPAPTPAPVPQAMQPAQPVQPQRMENRPVERRIQSTQQPAAPASQVPQASQPQRMDNRPVERRIEAAPQPAQAQQAVQPQRTEQRPPERRMEAPQQPVARPAPAAAPAPQAIQQHVQQQPRPEQRPAEPARQNPPAAQPAREAPHPQQQQHHEEHHDEHHDEGHEKK